MKPARSWERMTRLPITFVAKASARSATSGSVTIEGISSTRCCTGTGLKKWRPSTCCGRSVAMPSFMIGIDDVFDARIASGDSMILSRLANTSSFSCSDSMIASTTRSRSAKSPRSVVNSIRVSTESRTSASSLPARTARPSDISMLSRPASRNFMSVSHTSTWDPERAHTSAIPAPIRPAPTTPTRSISTVKTLFRSGLGPAARGGRPSAFWREKIAGRSVGIQLAGGDPGNDALEARAVTPFIGSPCQRLEHECAQFITNPAFVTFAQVGHCGDVVIVDGLGEVFHPGAVRRHRRHDPWPPRTLAALEHELQVSDGRVDTWSVGLVHDEHVGDLEQPCLTGLDLVSPTRVQDDDGGVGRRRHTDLGLADPDRLDDDAAETGCIEHPHRLRCRSGQSAEVPTARHRADVHAGIRLVPDHPDAITQDGAARERARRVDREHRDLVVRRAMAPPRDEG